jgi:hypothetical protein
MKRVAPLLAVVGIALLVGPGPAAAEVIELSADDRKAIEKHLGPDVIGDAVEGNPIADAAQFFAFEDGAWTFRFTSGDNKDGTTGRYLNGPNLAYFLRRGPEGDISIISEQDTQYRFLVEGVGVVAMIDKKNISALLFYHDNSKFGKVLV